MHQSARDVKRAGKSIAFVPTMGFLHEGHLSLIREARRLADIVVVSMFVNPTQFGPGEDFEAYPRDPARDSELAENEDTDILFIPEKQDLYPPGYETYIIQENLPGHLCGISRPGHFTGVMTIVAKLFNIIKPHYAVFGEKDFQQLAVIRKMVSDLNFDVKIIGSPTVRETDGLAMSSRNKYLSSGQRSSALTLYRALCDAKEMTAKGETRADALIDAAVQTISAAPETSIDYVKICDPDTLEDVAVIDRPVLMGLAVKVGRTRLIDNTILQPGSRG
ncbi:MAG: pantoate--beta-alanine ligase [Desulfobacteraceae bacterium]|nr:pantoate--beta-alanine ligase [Desulfobacteraceae bacterium]